MKKSIYTYLFIAAFPVAAYGNCYSYYGNVESFTYTIPGNLTIASNAPNGNVFDSLWISGGKQVTVECKLDGGGWANGLFGIYTGLFNTAQPIPNQTNIYATNIDGLGIQTNYWIDNKVNPGSADGYPVYSGFNWKNEANLFGWYFVRPTFRVRLYKYGPINPGILTTGGKAEVWMGGGVPGAYAVAIAPATLFFSGSMTVKAPSCTLDNSNITVKLPTVGANSLKGIGGHGADTRFDIGMLCNGGTKVSYQLDAVSPAGMPASSGVIQAGASSTTTGVGVQLLNATSFTPASYGQKLLISNSAATNEHFTLPMVARYYQVSSNATPGAINATATITLFYE